MANVRIGTCKLTIEKGHFVKSHIIPQALTERVWRGAPLVQEGRVGQRSIRRWSSWYDNQLVIARGEELLSKYDTWGINFLREHRLIWSSWGPALRLGGVPDYHMFEASGWGARRIVSADLDCLRLFFLSLLWRAAATSLFEFDLISLEPPELERLRRMVLEGEVKPYSFFPVSITQLSTLGFPHNQSGGRSVKRIPMRDESSGVLIEGQFREVDIFRLYFDGLTAHFHINDEPKCVTGNNVFVGGAEDLLVTTVTYEVSTQRRFLEAAVSRTVT